MNDTFWDVVCGFAHWWHMLAIIDVVVLGLLALSFTTVDPGSGTFVVAVMTAVSALVGLGLYGFIVWGCRKRADFDLLVRR